MISRLINALLCCLCLMAAQSVQAATNELANSGFEDATSGKVTAWKTAGAGYELDREAKHAGRQSIRCESRERNRTCGVSQIIRYEKPDKRPIIFGGWSKAEGVTGSDYCVFLDIIYEDGTPCWGQTCAWSLGSHDWEYAAQRFYPTKPVREIRAYVFLRKAAGKAWFDDIFIHRGGFHILQARSICDFPHTATGQSFRAELTRSADWRCVLLDAGNNAIDALSGKGAKISWDWHGREDALPERLRISAKSSEGEEASVDVAVAKPPARAANPVRRGYAIWWQSAMRKVYPTEFPPPRKCGEAAISLARNEHEGFQLAITPADRIDLRDVSVSFGEFVNERGEVFPREGIQQHLVGYVRVEKPSDHPDAPALPNWCPDALLPARSFDVPGGRTQTVWVDFYASDAVPTGTYRGRVIVQPKGLAATELRTSVHVWNFALPCVPRMKTAFAIMDGYTRAMYGNLTPELRRRCMDLILSHRLNPDDISRTEPPEIADLLYAREHGLNTFTILNLVPKPKGNPLWVCYSELNDYKPGFTQELAARLDEYMRELRAHNLSKMACFYGFDERGPEYDELIKGICKFLKERYPEVSTFTTAGYMYDKRRRMPRDYNDYMDWYCPLTPKYDRELSRQLRAQGKKVWWYVCCGPKHPYANFASMDYPSIEGRLLGWLTYSFEADGLLYWHMNSWQPNKIILGKDPYLDWKPLVVANMTGDGCLTYPSPEGPVSSIRLENVRDGLEDYDYLALLADAKGRATADAYAARLIKSQTNFTRDPAELYSVRSEIAALLQNRK